MVSLERGVCSCAELQVFVYSTASLFFLQRLKGNMSGDASDFNNMETRAVIKFPPSPARQGAEGNSRHSDRNIRGKTPSYATVKNWMAQFKRGDFFPPVMRLVLDDPKQ